MKEIMVLIPSLSGHQFKGLNCLTCLCVCSHVLIPSLSGHQFKEVHEALTAGEWNVLIPSLSGHQFKALDAKNNY